MEKRKLKVMHERSKVHCLSVNCMESMGLTQKPHHPLHFFIHHVISLAGIPDSGGLVINLSTLAIIQVCMASNMILLGSIVFTTVTVNMFYSVV